MLEFMEINLKFNSNMKNLEIIIISLSILFFVSCKQKSGYKNNSKYLIEKKVDSVLNLMTLEEKIGQMNQYNGFWDVTGPKPKSGEGAEKYKQLASGHVGSMLNVKGVKNIKRVQRIAVEETRLGIPLIIGFDVIHGYRTITPIPLAESASWDLEAIQKSAAMAAEEAAASGINWTFAPMVDISRDPRWGRVMEGAGEDAFLGTQIALARLRGFQGDDLSKPNTIAACAKHFAAYGFAESGKDYNTVDISRVTLHNVILPPFKALAKNGIKTFMNSFNELDGIPATGSEFLQRYLLKQRWGFEGFVVSDWGSIGEMINHGYVKDNKQAAMKAIKAGSDMDMESYSYINHLSNLVKENKVSQELIDEAVKRILRVKFELGLFDDPYLYCDEDREKKVVWSKKNREIALDIAKKSIVLLKNENQLLPLKKKGLNIAVIGDLADDKDSPIGNWPGDAIRNSAISVLEGLAEYPKNNITYSQGVRVKLTDEVPSFMLEIKINNKDRKGIKKAVRLAKGKDVVIMVLGEYGFMSGEGRSRANIDLPGLQQELLEAVYKVNKNIILVLMNGRPLTINWADKNIPAIVEAWHLGTESGRAIANIIYGDYNPSGKLPMTFPKSVGQIPIYYNYKNTGRPNEPAPDQVFWAHYTDESNDPLYPFGYGLSYTKFKYDDIRVSKKKINSNENLEVSCVVSNIGQYAGTEIVQLYIRDLVASITRPIKELKGFKKIFLKPNESKKVIFDIDKSDLIFYDEEGKEILEAGEFKIFIGGSSKTSLETSFTLVK